MIITLSSLIIKITCPGLIASPASNIIMIGSLIIIVVQIAACVVLLVHVVHMVAISISQGAIDIVVIGLCKCVMAYCIQSYIVVTAQAQSIASPVCYCYSISASATGPVAYTSVPAPAAFHTRIIPVPETMIVGTSPPAAI